MMRRRFLPLLPLALLASTSLWGQGGGLPPLQIEEVTVIGRRSVILPKARKGEVLDSSFYLLPASDTLLFGERISSLGGTGGALPVYRELEPPLNALGELSIGSYLSPHALLRIEYLRSNFDIGGVVDYRATRGHTDSAEASAFELGAHGGILLGDESTPLRRFRLSAEFDRLGQSYFLYGNRATPFDRSTTTTGFGFALRSLQEHPVGYHAELSYKSTTLSDRIVDTIPEVSAGEPSFGFGLAGDIDSALRGSVDLSYSTSSLHYSQSTFTPATVRLAGNLEWSPVEQLYLNGGVIYANGQFSDSGSTSLIMPRFGIRYELSGNLSLFGWFSPELRAGLYRDRLATAPYVDREIILRPELVPVRLSGGFRYSSNEVTVEGRGVYEEGENTPVVAADSASPGGLAWVYIGKSRSVGFEASLKLRPADDLTLDADMRVGTYTDSGDVALPMRPSLDLQGRIDYAATSALGLYATFLYRSTQRVLLPRGTVAGGSSRDLGTEFLVGLGGSYRIVKNLEAFAGVTNLLGLKYDRWDGYSAPGIEVRAGVRIAIGE